MHLLELLELEVIDGFNQLLQQREELKKNQKEIKEEDQKDLNQENKSDNVPLV